ncbi:invasion protein IalB/pimeloyl-ACP methyl ester carboxylesterase [Bradyrhizobium sp. USDA 372]
MRSLARTVLVALLTWGSMHSGLTQGSDSPRLQEELWGLPFDLPTLAYVVHPVGEGPFPLIVMNHGVAMDPKERSFFPLVEFRDAAFWFARHGYLVVAPLGPGFGGTGISNAERAVYGPFFLDPGGCERPNFRGVGLVVAALDKLTIDYFIERKLALPRDVLVVGQSAGGWGAIALSSENPPNIRAIITFAAGRGGHVNGVPNNNCAPDMLVQAAGDFGRTSRIPMLWLYSKNDTYFGPEISKRMHDAFTAAGGNAEYHLLPAVGGEGHILIDVADAMPLWTPLVSDFLEKHPATQALPQMAQSSAAQNDDKPPEAETGPRGQRMPRNITYSEWQKICFKDSVGQVLCRTTTTGNWDTGQMAVRVDVIERQGDSAKRLQIMLPVGLYLQHGVKVSVDDKPPVRIPYNWCLTNLCVAGDLVDPSLLQAMDVGHKLTLEVVESNLLAVASSISLDRFAPARSGGPAKTIDYSDSNK